MISDIDHEAYAMWTILLLTISNVFMTYAWYYHLKNPGLKSGPIWIAIVVSWAIALLEYIFQVPANRLGSQAGYSVSQLKILQEAITLGVFLIFVAYVMGERLRWNHFVGFALVLAGVAVVFAFREPPAGKSEAQQATLSDKEAAAERGRS